MLRPLLTLAAIAALLPGLARADSDVPTLAAGTSLTSAAMYLANAGATNNKLGLTTSVFDIAAGALTLKAGGISDAMLASTFLKINAALGTPVSGVGTNLTGTAAGLTAGNVTTNANLTGPVTSTGNATAIAGGAISDAMLASTFLKINPALGNATATSLNKWTFTAPTTAATLTAGGDSLTYTMPAASKTIAANDYSNMTTLTANAFLTGGGAATAPNAVAITGLVKGNGASAPAAATAADIPATPLTTGTTVTLAGPREYAVCPLAAGGCTYTLPLPVAGYEFCVMNGPGVTATGMTLAALGGGAMYEDTKRAAGIAGGAYGTAGTGILYSGNAPGDRVCVLGLDSTHYLTVSFVGTWTAT